MSSIQNLAPIMPFIEPTEPIELPSVFQLESSNNLHTPAWKGKANASSPDQSMKEMAANHVRTASEEEALLEKTRMELEQKIGELNRLKNQLAQTEKRTQELASRIPA